MTMGIEEEYEEDENEKRADDPSLSSQPIGVGGDGREGVHAVYFPPSLPLSLTDYG